MVYIYFSKCHEKEVERITFHSNPQRIHPRHTMKWKTSFRVSKLEDMIKVNVKMDDLVKLENNMASKENLKGMSSKGDLKRMSSKGDLKGMASKEDLKRMTSK